MTLTFCERDDHLTPTQEMLLAALSGLGAKYGNHPFPSHIIARDALMHNPDQSRCREQLKIMTDKGYCTSSPKGYVRTAKPYPPQALARRLSD